MSVRGGTIEGWGASTGPPSLVLHVLLRGVEPEHDGLVRPVRGPAGGRHDAQLGGRGRGALALLPRRRGVGGPLKVAHYKHVLSRPQHVLLAAKAEDGEHVVRQAQRSLDAAVRGACRQQCPAYALAQAAARTGTAGSGYRFGSVAILARPEASMRKVGVRAEAGKLTRCRNWGRPRVGRRMRRAPQGPGAEARTVNCEW